MELLHTTLSILCLINPPAPSSQNLHEYLMTHNITNDKVSVEYASKTDINCKLSFLFDYTAEIINNIKSKVDFDSIEHIPLFIKKYFLENPNIRKELYLAVYDLEKHKENSSQLTKRLSSEESTKSIEYIYPSKPSPNNTDASSIWSISTDTNNKQQITLNLFFNSTKQLSSWLSDISTSNYNNFFQETFNLITMRFIELPFRCYYYLNYNKEPRHIRYRYMLNEEVQQCNTIIDKIISPKAKKNLIPELHHLTYSLNQVSMDGLFLEFGVWMGKTITHIATVRPRKIIHGFDSFEGLRKEWNNFPPGQFGMNGELPSVPSNVILHKGYFKNVLPIFKQELQKNKPIAFMHIDSDLYESAKDIFKNLGDLIVPGTIIVFDDFLYNTNWIQHEPLAFANFLKKRNDLTFEYITFTGTHPVAIRILKK